MVVGLLQVQMHVDWLVRVGQSGSFPSHLILLTSRWWSVERSASFFTWMSETYGYKSDDITTKSVINLQWPGTKFAYGPNMVFFMASQWLAQTPITKHQLMSPPGLSIVAHMDIEVHKKKWESLDGAISRTPPEDSKKARFSNCHSVCKHKQQSEPSPQWLSVTQRQPSQSSGRTLKLWCSARGLAPGGAPLTGWSQFSLMLLSHEIFELLLVWSLPESSLPWETLQGAIAPDNIAPRITGKHKTHQHF